LHSQGNAIFRSSLVETPHENRTRTTSHTEGEMQPIEAADQHVISVRLNETGALSAKSQNQRWSEENIVTGL
jgi:hypothetical protein